MLGGIDATMVQFARSALDRTGDIARQAIASNPDRSGEEIDALCESIHGPLIDTPKMHGALVGATEADAAGLNVTQPPEYPTLGRHLDTVDPVLRFGHSGAGCVSTKAGSPHRSRTSVGTAAPVGDI